ncbi:MAG TPA: fused MFS/spermidine synthase [Fimbriiglobus sp.]|nr:fused MFS/spermidine synthase [Fimbriiglobus sp.]
MLPALFALTLFLSAALLFVVQPMAGKVLLPLAGGTPAVWNTCLVFFQTALLFGYLYAHRLTAAPTRRQVGLHLAVAALAIVAVLTLRPDPDWVPADSDYPVFGLAAFLAALVGVPFFVLSATAPLLQRWFAATGHRSAADPYFLYAASNAGSLLGLLGYPFLVEPWLPLGEQRWLWAVGFAGLVGLMALCGVLVGRAPVVQSAPKPDDGGRRASLLRILKWVALAALPSSLLMGVTTHLTTDVAPVPLLWVVPLALYLLSFVVVFARWPEIARRLIGRVAPALLVFLVVALLTAATEPITLIAGVHLAAFFGVALLCHGELAHDRPGRDHLTAFYLALSAGGVLGGLFNALLAPVLFSHLGLIEYPLAIVLAGLVRPMRGGSLAPLRVQSWDVMLVLTFGVAAAALALCVPLFVPLPADPDSPDALMIRLVRGGLMYGLPAVVAFALVRSPARFAACLAMLLFAGQLDPGPHGETLLTTRNFFGTLRVTRSADGKFIRLVHGTTQHGQQRTDETGPPRPMMYYHQNGPVGRLFAKLPPERTRRVGLVGLGCGAMAAYAGPGQEWTFYEIDPAVVRIASDPKYFTFLAKCKVSPRIVLGDARRKLAEEPDGHFDLIVLDAFSSDAIPVHLLTKEAFALYAKKLASGGVLAFHLSNRYLDLPPLVARLGADHDPPFSIKVDRDIPSDRDREDGKFPSVWAVLARDPADLGAVAKDPHWQTEPVRPGPLWRDDFSNLLAVWKKYEE